MKATGIVRRIDNYGSIDEAVRTVIANGLEKEAHMKNGRNGMKKPN